MPIPVQCPDCGKRYAVRDDMAGKRVQCSCGSTMMVAIPAAPREDASSSAEPAPVAKPALRRAPPERSPYASRPYAGPRRRRHERVDPFRYIVGVLAVLFGLLATLAVLRRGDPSQVRFLFRLLIAVLIAVGGVLILIKHPYGPSCAGLSCVIFCFFPAWALLLLILALLSKGEFNITLQVFLLTLVEFGVPAGITVWCLKEESKKRRD